ncbi:MAG: FtsK/SpoIIIE domain-containing protein [Arachnia sp.]
MVDELAQVRAQLAEAKAALREADGFLRDTLARANGAINAARTRHQLLLRETEPRVDALLAEGRPELYHAWHGAGWDAWNPATAIPTEVRVGEASLGWATPPVTVPLFAGRSVVVTTAGASAAGHARQLLRSVAVRLSLALGHLGTLHLIDPAQEGYGFPERDVLPNIAPIDSDPAKALARVIDAAYVRRDSPDGRCDVVIALDFPQRYGYGAASALNRIARLSAAGVQLIVGHDTTCNDPGRGDDLDLDSPVALAVDSHGLATHAWGSIRATVDEAPGRRLVAALAQRMPQPTSQPIGETAKVRFRDLNPVQPEQWWRDDATDLVSVPVARTPDGSTIEIRFGQTTGDIAHTHAVVGGQAGSGKSELLHTIITGVATRYRPSDVQLYLIDGQAGVSFQRYRALPHADLVSLNSPLDLARGVLLDIDTELRRRETLLTQTGTQSLPEYRNVTGQPMPRLIVIIDEYQRLFEGDRRHETAGVLQRIAALGRKVGIHLLLASQRFHATGLLNQDALFNNISTRIGLMLPPDSLGAVDEFGRGGRQLLGRCSRPGDVVVNHHGGSDGHNLTGRVAWLGTEPPADLLSGLADADPRRPEVVDGKVSPNLGNNIALSRLAELTPTVDAVQEWAEASPRDAGLGVNSWQPYDQPWPAILGRSFTARGSAVAKVDRAAEHNLAFVVSDAAALHGMMAVGLVSAALVAPHGVEVWTLHQLVGPGQPWLRALTGDLETCLAGTRVRHGESCLTVLSDATSELARRESLAPEAQGDCAPLIVAATGLDKVADFRKVEGRYGDEPSPATAQLIELARRGTFVGIHLAVGFTSVPQWQQVMPKNASRRFVHRVVSQLAEDHSRVIVDGSFASRVMPAGTDGPQRCGYHNRDTGEQTVFLPYRYDEALPGELEAVWVRRSHGP